MHQRKQCLISQREVGVHTKGFAAALQSGLREDPDVVLVGELRDYETISIAVTAAEMGILVMGTLHTNGAAQTVDRMINVFPADKQSHVRTMLSTSLRGVVSQQLLQKADKSGRVAALEILVNTPAVSNLIRQGKLDQLETTMQSGSQFGMRTMDSAIEALLNQRMITGKEAYKKGINKAKFEPVQGPGLSSLSGASRLYLRALSGPAVFMPRKILVTSALPYANGALHLGHIIEAVQTDIWVRFQRMQGHDCIYVCAEDTHGTPVMIKAQAEGITPEELITRMAAEHRADYEGFLIGHDHFHSTHSPENKAITAELYGKLKAAGHITTRSVRQAYDEKAGMFLPDRYVKGECPVCHTADQYGDSCENCGSTYTPDKLINPVSTHQRHAAGVARVRALLLQARRFHRGAAPVAGRRRRAPARSARQARRVVRGGPAGLGHLARRALLRLRDPGRARQVFLRVVRRAHRLPRQLQGAVRQTRPGLRRVPEGRQHHRAVSLHRQGHQLLPQPVLAGGAARLGLPQADGGVRARLPHDQRREDVEVARHVHHRAAIPRARCRPSRCASTSRASSAPASTTSTCRSRISSRA